MNFLSIVWDFDPQIVDFLPPRWYGLLFGMAFIVAQQLMTYVYKQEGLNEKHIDWMLVYMVAGTILGARLGHCLFYDWQYYTQDFEHIVSILYVWEGGLASHGGGIGLFLASWLFARKYKVKSYLWLLDRIALTVVIGGAFIRFGNFANSEIVGHPTNKSWGVVFVENARTTVQRIASQDVEVTFERRETEEEMKDSSGVALIPLTMTVEFEKSLSDDNSTTFQNNLYSGYSSYGPMGLNVLPDSESHVKLKDLVNNQGNKTYTFSAWGVPRHPAQLYESLSCLLIFALLFLFYVKNKANTPEGILTGLFLITVFTLRFLYEYIKEDQVAIEAGMALNIGQKLSIPMVILGIILVAYSLMNKKKDETQTL